MRVLLMPCLGFCLSVCFSLESEELSMKSLLDPSMFQMPFSSEFQKDKTMTEARLCNGTNPILKNSMLHKDKKAILHGHVQDPSLQWEWGFRNGLKYDRPQEELLIAANYTHFHSKSYASLERGGELLPLWYEVGSLEAKSLERSSDSNWRLDVEIADLEIGKVFKLQKFVTLRPHVGFRGTVLYQNFDIDYEKFARGVLQEPLFWNNCVAWGSRGGIDTSWKFGKGFSLFGDGAVSWLSGYRNIQEKIFSVENTIAKSRVAVMECSLGMQYEKSFSDSLCSLTIKTGYEFNYFLNKQSWSSWFSPIAAGNMPGEKISLQGLSLGFRLDF